MVSRRDVLGLSVAAALALAGCARDRAGDTVPEDAVPYGAEAGEPIDDVLSRWRQQRDENKPFGLAATASLAGEGMVVHAEDVGARASVEGAFTLAKEGAIDGGVVCSGVTVDGESADALVVHGSTLEVRGGRLADASFERVACADPVGVHLEDSIERDAPKYPDPPDEQPEEPPPSAHDYVGGPLEADELSGFNSAYFVRDGERTAITDPVSVSAEHLWVVDGTVVEAGSARVEAPRFSLAAPKGTTGTIEVEGRENVVDPFGLFGSDATLDLEQGRFETDGSFRLTQAMLEDEFALDSTVDVLPATTSVSVPAGETRWVDVYYRERSYVGDGVLGGVSIDASAEGVMEVPVAPPTLLVQKVIEELDDNAAEGFVLAAAAPGLWALALGEILATALDCAFNDCPSEHPYPSWIDAGSVDRFYYRVNATDLEPGEYEATATIEGANYGAVEIPVSVTVTEPTETPTDEA